MLPDPDTVTPHPPCGVDGRAALLDAGADCTSLRGEGEPSTLAVQPVMNSADAERAMAATMCSRAAKMLTLPMISYRVDPHRVGSRRTRSGHAHPLRAAMVTFPEWIISEHASVRRPRCC
jgi:hypothetical protein